MLIFPAKMDMGGTQIALAIVLLGDKPGASLGRASLGRARCQRVEPEASGPAYTEVGTYAVPYVCTARQKYSKHMIKIQHQYSKIIIAKIYINNSY